MPFPCVLERQTQMVFNDTRDVASYFFGEETTHVKSFEPYSSEKTSMAKSDCLLIENLMI